MFVWMAAILRSKFGWAAFFGFLFPLAIEPMFSGLAPNLCWFTGSWLIPIPFGMLLADENDVRRKNWLLGLLYDASRTLFPAYCPDRQFTLTGEQIRIGRLSRSRGLVPEIDLTGPPQDPGVSHLHAVLLAQDGGGWVVVDPGSTNGTTLVRGGSKGLAPASPETPTSHSTLV